MPDDLRKYARQTNIQLAVGAVLLLFIIGDGLIYLFYGAGAAVFGILCLLGGMVPVVLVVLVLLLFDWIQKRANRD
jgi:membrane protein implicated in regulation of membrane protease activity